MDGGVRPLGFVHLRVPLPLAGAEEAGVSLPTPDKLESGTVFASDQTWSMEFTNSSGPEDPLD
jgi:hypothetical protein